MKVRHLGRLLLFALLSATWLWAGEVWEEKSYTEWTLEEAQLILRDSPWAQTLEDPARGAAGSGEASQQEPLLSDVPKFGTVSGTASGRSLSGSVQWVSSFTMRQAMARAGQLQGTMRAGDATQLMMMNPQQYVIAVRGEAVSLVMAGLPEQTQEALQQSAYLQPQGGEKIVPLGIEVNLEGAPAAFFYFPRGAADAPLLRPEQETVEFNWSSGLDTVKMTFTLGEMVRGGKLDL
jgi:hypothetical protein